jgi:hypothetical protein
MTDRPHDTVLTALIDAVSTGPIHPDGGVDRAAVECAEAVASIANNLATQRYRDEHPDMVLDDGTRLGAIEEGRRLLAVDGVEWLLDNGHLWIEGEQGLGLGPPIKIRSGDGATERYVPGTHREEELFHTIRRVIPQRLDLLRESITMFGDLREYFPVLEDVDGNVVDGRHRRALDPTWPATKRKVPRHDRVATAVIANRANAWSAADWKRLRAHAQYVGDRDATQYELARLALLEDHERANRVIANLVGCDEVTVRRVRADLEEIAALPQFRATAGRPRKDGTPAQPKRDDPQLIAVVREHVVGGTYSRTVADELAARFDTSHGIVDEVRSFVRGQLQPNPIVAPEVVEPEVVDEVEDEQPEPEVVEPDPIVEPEVVDEPESEPEVVRIVLAGTARQLADQIFRAASPAFRAELVGYLIAGSADEREVR